MINKVLSFSVRAHWSVVFVTLMVAGYGIFELTRLPLDALPDITSKQAMINYAAPALGPEDIEKRITFPIETAISGLAGVESTRSFSRNGDRTGRIRSDPRRICGAPGQAWSDRRPDHRSRVGSARRRDNRSEQRIPA